MKTTRERNIEAHFCRAVKAAGGETRKFLGRKNNPDRLVLWPARASASGYAMVHFVELKRPGKKPRRAQARELKRLDTMGFVAIYLDTKELIDFYVKTWRD